MASGKPCLSGIAEAVALAGNQTELAEKLGVSQQIVSLWLRRGWVPRTRAAANSVLTGVVVARLANPRAHPQPT